MNKKFWLRVLLPTIAICLVVDPAPGQDQDANGRLQVFILAGQSNMEGKGSVETMNHQLQDEKKRARFEHLVNGEKFVERDDVFISYLGNQGVRTGKLTVGYGTSRKDDQRLFGPELGFGWKMGEALEQPVLIIKTAWGGKSLDRDFRPPSRKYPESIEQHFENRKKKNADYTMKQCREEYGNFYRQMISHVRGVLQHPEKVVPGYDAAAGYDLVGLVWFQGFNDQFEPTSVEDYEDNMVAFMADVRKDLNAPELRFVIGAMGHGGANQKDKVKLIADAQAAAADRDGANATVVRTANFWDVEAHDAFKKYWADKPNRDVEKWKTFGNDRPYHYLGSPKFFLEIGDAFADAMIELMR